jgi:iron complex outermembrane receptor protein
VFAASGRVDRHSEYGTFLSPRLSLRLRPGPVPSRWNARVSLGNGYFAPSRFTEETEVIGLTRLLPLRNLKAERAMTGSLDIGATLGGIEVHATAFASVIRHPAALRGVLGKSNFVELVNLPEPTRTSGCKRGLRRFTGRGLG